MPNYGLPGVAINRRRALAIGAAAIVTIAVCSIGTQVLTDDEVDGTRVVLRTESLGDGIVKGTRVRADGVLVGSVTDIAPAERGTQTVTLRVSSDQLDGIDDSMRVDYATSNLFGISEIQLLPGKGGSPLRDGAIVDLTGSRAADTFDATMGGLLRSLSNIGDEALVTRLAEVLEQMSTDVRAFTPLLEAMVVSGRTLADTQTLPLSYQIGRYGSVLAGAGTFAASIVDMIDVVYRVQILRDERQKFDGTINMVVEELFPGVADLMYPARDQFSDYAAMAVPILSAAALTVPTPQQTSADLAATLGLLRSALRDTPEGPVLALDVDLRITPAVLGPLLGTLGVPQ
ncbi:MlaD family protein [Nocardia salmonicida]|uniref:MlaD family protein n=1 Tax=Nocardia salmonicida TaxID=53431 RepID=UPI003435C610